MSHPKLPRYAFQLSHEAVQLPMRLWSFLRASGASSEALRLHPSLCSVYPEAVKASKLFQRRSSFYQFLVASVLCTQ
jgi:hypothetical protein